MNGDWRPSASIEALRVPVVEAERVECIHERPLGRVQHLPALFATQIDPAERFWFGLPDHVQDAIHPFDDYMLMRSRIDTTMPETDLFAGLR